jgi:acyl carrier protein
LDSFPLTSNGKIDRKALLVPENEKQFIDFIEPRTEIEGLVAQTWREVLKKERIGIQDNFFELGGHSLLATQIVANLRDVFEREVPLSLLFNAPTVADLSSEIAQRLRDGDSPKLPPITSVSREGPLPVSVNQEHLWRVDQAFPGIPLFTMPYVYQLTGNLDVEALERAFTKIISRHEALRTVFPEVDGRPVQLIQDSAGFHLPVIDLRSSEPEKLGEKTAVLIWENRQASFDLQVGPLIEIKLLRLTQAVYFLLVTMHHIIGDYCSMQVLRRELAAMYEAFSQGLTPPMAVAPIHFGDYAAWERELLQSGLFESQLNYWKQRLAPPLPKLQFKQHSIRNNEANFQTSRTLIEVDDVLFPKIKELATQENCTPFMVVLAALNVVLYGLTDQEDIRIGTLVANRRSRETANVIGHFLNTVILRTRLSAELTYRQLLKQVREVTLAAYVHQELPFEQLCCTLEKERKIERGSLFQVLLSYQSYDFHPVNLPGLTFAPLGWQLPASYSQVTLTACDLIVNIRETATKFTGSVNYKTDTFDNDVVTSMVERFPAVLKHMVVETEQQLLRALFVR